MRQLYFVVEVSENVQNYEKRNATGLNVHNIIPVQFCTGIIFCAILHRYYILCNFEQVLYLVHSARFGHRLKGISDPK